MRFRSANTLNDALGWLAESGDEAQVLAGGTDVMIQLQRAELSPEALIYIGRVEALQSINNANGYLRLGALVTHRRVWKEVSVSTLLPALAEASATVGGWQTQEVGTIVGNVVNASPAADTIPALFNAGCVVQLASANATRACTLSDFIRGRRKTSRSGDELVTGLDLEPVGPRTGETYIKVGPRGAMEVALVGLAVRLNFAPDYDTVEEARIAVCSVAEVPYRATEAEMILTGSKLERDAVDEAGRVLEQSSDPIDDQRASARYRKRILAPLLGRAVDEARRRALGRHL